MNFYVPGFFPRCILLPFDPDSVFFFFIYLLRPFEICENANLVNAISIQSYEESFRSGALLHYPSKHPVSSQFPDFCKTRKWRKMGKRLQTQQQKEEKL